MDISESVSLNVHRTVTLAHLYTHESILVRKVKVLDKYLQKLQSIVNDVADGNNG